MTRNLDDAETDTLAGPVAAVIAEYDDVVRERLLELRALILEVAAETDGVGPLTETLKWNQPAYLTEATRSGTTVRVDRVRGKPGWVAMLTHCQTSLVDAFRDEHGDAFRYDGERAIEFAPGEPVDVPEIRDQVRAALTYHRR